MTKEPKWKGYIIVSDHDRKLISVHGPMTDDTRITEQVADARKAGRDINCSSDDGSLADAKAEAKAMQPDYVLVENALHIPKSGQISL